MLTSMWHLETRGLTLQIDERARLLIKLAIPCWLLQDLLGVMCTS